jgi:H+/Cl- antiporter ClcA
MKQARILLLSALAGVGAAITYYYFEYAVRHSITYLWHDVLHTETHRWMLVPLCIVISLLYFGAQHLFDRPAEKKESHGLGAAPQPSVINFIKVLAIGYLSLIAGASLGPEAVLVPACVVLGSYLGTKLMPHNKPAAQALSLAGFIGLFAAFFHSFYVGLIALLLIRRQFKINIDIRLLLIGVVASGGSALTLGILDSSAYVTLPAYSWSLNLATALLLILLAAAGYGAIHLLGALHTHGEQALAIVKGRPWWQHALLASGILSVLYLLGGSLVQFTGNESIVPMFRQASDLGLWGLLWILLVKLGAIAWSKASGYRGGMIFPTIFVASVIIAIAGRAVADINLIYGLVAVLVGAFAADSKVKILV